MRPVCAMTPLASGENFKANSRKYRGAFKVKSRVKTRQVREIWSQHANPSPVGFKPATFCPVRILTSAQDYSEMFK